MRSRIDAVHILTIVLFVLIALPSRLTFAPLGGAGAPALILGLGCFTWWSYHHVQRAKSETAGVQPVRAALLVMMACFLVSYVVAMTRAIDPAEMSTADIGLLSLFSWAGILLLANDGIPSRTRLQVFVRRLIFAGGALSTLGVVQFVTGEAWVDRISVPGLSVNTALTSVLQRSGFNRPGGTAIHPIEFGAVITMILPIAINTALTDRARGRVRRWYPVLAIALAVSLSISRSAIVCAVVGLLVVAWAWTPATRRRAAAVAAAFLATVCLTVPGLLGSVTALFTGIGADSSASSRTGSYAIATEFIARDPFFGRGFSTFLPAYRILDNQYLVLAIEVGVVGMVSVIALLVAAAGCARRLRRVGADESTRQLGQSLFASVFAGAVGMALYDGFGFPMATGVLFLILGLAGAGLRLEHLESNQATSRPVPLGTTR